MWWKLHKPKTPSDVPGRQDDDGRSRLENMRRHCPRPPERGEQEPDSTRILRLSGDLRSGTDIESVRRRGLASVRPGLRRVVIDLEYVDEADTKLIACLLYLRRIADSAGVRLEVRLSPRVRQWLELCQAGYLLPPSAEERSITR